jgi:hypothetical protein
MPTCSVLYLIQMYKYFRTVHLIIMLEITVNNQYLQLPDDIQIGVIIESPLFVDDRLPVPFSLSFEIPPTPHNLAIFGYPNRLGVHEDGKLFTPKPSKIYFESISIQEGSTSLLQYNKTLKLSFKGIDFNDNLKTALYNKDVEQKDFEGSATVLGYDNPLSYQYYYKSWANSLAYNTSANYIAAPINVKTANSPFSFWRDHASGNAQNAVHIRMSTEMETAYLSMFNVDTQSFMFSEDDGRSNTVSPIFPLFRLPFLINTIIGSNLETSPFDNAVMNDILVPSFFFKGLRRSQLLPLMSNAWLTNPPYVKFADYMPDVEASKFLRTILNLFCMTLIAHKGRFIVATNKSIFEKPITHDWTSKVIDEIAPESVEGQYYDYGYDGIEYFSTDQNVIEVNTHEEMMNTSFDLPNHEATYDQHFYIKNTNEYYLKTAFYKQYKANFTDQFELMLDYVFKGYKDPAIDHEVGEKTKYDARSEIKQLHLQPSVYFTSLTNNDIKKFWVVPRWTPENGNDISTRNVRPTNISLLLYAGIRKTIDGNKDYPFVSPYKNANMSLEWEGPDGLLAKYHFEFKNWVEKTKLKISGTFLLSALELNKLIITDKIHIGGRNFFIEKLQYTIRKNRIDPVVVDLIEV